MYEKEVRPDLLKALEERRSKWYYNNIENDVELTGRTSLNGWKNESNTQKEFNIKEMEEGLKKDNSKIKILQSSRVDDLLNELRNDGVVQQFEIIPSDQNEQ